MSTRLGMLTPSSNTVLEPYASAIVGDLEGDVTAHFQRFEVQDKLGEGSYGRVFVAVDREIERMKTAEDATVILVDFHAEATSEKIAMGRWLDGKASVVVGTHTHVQTSDETIFPGGTAYLTDAGMCGPLDSVLGRKHAPVVERFRTGIPQRFPVAVGVVGLRGLIADIDEADGRALAVERFSEDYLPR